ncbi:XdhC family protein [Neobacillus sp. PS3-34]|uniref:XdhC family protein n=1 Tax=Neobacillus sp. PS3-34 TaxID=3070678 RepID=UPI0027E01B24|nr:XdhC family protein [Neobacillus sp. PS3-34]WML48816.1 XdhC family protein [Neobacillus sp. PS3-34]
MKDFHQLFDRMDRAVLKTVLATIIQVEGSAYKKEGSCMLFFEDGTQNGMISAGCLEQDLSHHAKKVFQEGKARMVQYDLRKESDLEWGQGNGCNGVIRILLEPVGEKEKEDFRRVKNFLDQGIQVLCLKKLEEEPENLFVPEQGEIFGQWHDSITKLEESSIQQTKFDSGVFHQLFLPKPRLFVFGAGTDAQPLVSLAAKAGFSVAVCDWRAEYCQKGNFPDADQLLIGFPAEIYKKERFTGNDFAIIRNHHFIRDKEWLSLLKKEKLRYLGVLGPGKEPNG